MIRLVTSSTVAVQGPVAENFTEASVSSQNSVLFVETQENGDMVNIGRNPASTSGSVFNVNFVYALKEDNSKFVEFIVKATLE